MTDEPTSGVLRDMGGEEMKWDEYRHAELELLDTLIRDVRGINSASHVLERLARCIEMAEKLSRLDLSTGRASFLYFLHGLSVEEDGSD